MFQYAKTFLGAVPFVAASLISLAQPVLAQTAPSPIAPNSSSVTPSQGIFFNGAVTPLHWKTTEIIGTAVYNLANERIGEVEQLVFDSEGRIVAGVLGVGGFLGMGERHVAVNFRSMQFSRNSTSTPRIVVDVTKGVLQAAPMFVASR